jgi:uncharacterized membrane protein (TIGR01666 family)
MDYLKSFKSFISSYYLTDGIRVTAGVLVPSLLMLYFNLLSIGIIISIGALCVSVTDFAGPITHRRNGMLLCAVTIFVVSILIGLATFSEVYSGILLFVFSFLFSMLGVYGTRSGALGIAALLVMVLNFNYQYNDWEAVKNALYILAGGTWYMLFSLSMYQIRPYKLVQQAMGDFIQNMAAYLGTRASFYDININYEAAYKDQIQQQILIQQEHELVSELLFKTRDIVKESTHTGRILVMIFLEASDLFDRIMTAYEDHQNLHKVFDETNILQDYRQLALLCSYELDEIGLALKNGRRSNENNELVEKIARTRKNFNQLRSGFMDADNLEGFISLRRILENIEDIARRLHTLHQYTSFDKKIKSRRGNKTDSENFITRQEVTLDRLLDNFTLESNIFRHALRVSVAALAGYLISLFFNIGHSYWILLTIIVILKPAYSLTQKRNKDRLVGTFGGALIGVVILFAVKNNTALFVIMVLFMAGSNVFLRKDYLLGVGLMTPYILIFFHLLKPADFQSLLIDRIVDTIIGSAIAFITTIAIVPEWEHKTIRSFMIPMLEHNKQYFEVIANAFLSRQPVQVNDLQKARKNALVSLANLSDAFNRMLSEPKSKQKEIEHLHQFVVLNHRLTSHIATLYYYEQAQLSLSEPIDITQVTFDIHSKLDTARLLLQNEVKNGKSLPEKESLNELYEEVNALMMKRREELKGGQLETSTKKTLSELKSVIDQFKFIYKISADLKKISTALASSNNR